eukprot:scaffold2756_cov376-Prasinococcus_capsulatus_cf.AAC.2
MVRRVCYRHIPHTEEYFCCRAPRSGQSPRVMDDGYWKKCARGYPCTVSSRSLSVASPAEPADVASQSLTTMPLARSGTAGNADADDGFGGNIFGIGGGGGSTDKVDEEAKLSKLISGSAASFQAEVDAGIKAGRGRGRGRQAPQAGAPPPGYICFRCNQSGHWIQNCPTNGDPDYDVKRMKFPVGIPRTFLSANTEGTLVLPDGSTAVMTPNE